MSREATERLRMADEQRWRAAGLRGNGHPAGERLMRAANEVRVCAELAWLAAFGDREAAALLKRGRCA